MSNTRFTIDAVPTPKIDLAQAFAKDLEYFVANKRMPPLGRSSFAKAEEQLNFYLRYVNESFIQEGFSASNQEVSTATDTPVLQWQNDGTVTFTSTLVQTAVIDLDPTEKANLHLSWNIAGIHEPSVVTDDEGVTTTTQGVLVVELWIDAVKQREWKQTLTTGYNTVGASVCYSNQPAGLHAIHLKVKCTAGTLAVATNDHYAYGYGQIVR